MKIRENLKKIGLFESIRGRLALYFVLLAVLPFLFIGVTAFQSEKAALTDRVREHLTSIADIQKVRIQSWLAERSSDARFIATDWHVAQGLARVGAVGVNVARGEQAYREIEDELGSITRNHEYLEAFLLDDKGNVVVSTLKGYVGDARADREYFQGALKTADGSVFMQDIYYSKRLGKIVMAYSSPVLSFPDKKRVTGVAVILVDMEKSFYPFFEVWPGMGKTGDTLIARREAGEVVYLSKLRYHQDAPLRFKIPLDVAPRPTLYATDGKEGIIEAKDYRGMEVLAAYRYIPEMKWGIVVKEDYDEAFASVVSLTRRVLILMAVTLVIVFILIYIITARITEPVVNLDRLAGRIAQGDFGVSLPVRRKDEVGSLANSFNEMAKSLMKYRTEVDEKNKALEGANADLVVMTASLEEKVGSRTSELEDLNRALISMMEDLDERSTALEASQVELRRYMSDLEESRNRVRDNLAIVERANVELRRIDRMKDQFLGMMSHELRTPLSLITGYSSNLLTEDSVVSDPKVQEGLEGILRGADRLKNIVTEMLDISQIDAKGIRLNLAPTDIGDLVEGTMKELDTFIRERKQKVVLGEFSGLPMLYLDARRMGQVLLNIIGNAIKFTPDGGVIEITPHVYPKGSEFVIMYGRQETDYLDLVVKDGGIGIDREESERIFEKFYEVGEIDKHATSKFRFLGRGVGLGLPIARGIIEAEGGRLWAESTGYDPEACPGSSFHMMLPLNHVAAQTALPDWTRGTVKARTDARMEAHSDAMASVASASMSDAGVNAHLNMPRYKVLIIDDDLDILNLTSLLLAREYEVHRAPNGNAGIELARQKRPDAILLDVYMEGINGYDVCEILKGDPATSMIPIAFFTAGVQRWEVERGYKVGADDYITKPFKPEVLMSKVRDLISGVYETAKDKSD